MPRPRAIQGEVEKRLLEALERGAPIRIACQYAGINPDTYYATVRDDPEFSEKATRARTQRAVESLDAIWTAGAEDWRAHAKYLELTFPDEFGRRLEVSGPGGGPVKVAAEVQPGFVADVLRVLGEGGDAPDPKGGAEPVHPALPDPSVPAGPVQSPSGRVPRRART